MLYAGVNDGGLIEPSAPPKISTNTSTVYACTFVFISGLQQGPRFQKDSFKISRAIWSYSKPRPHEKKPGNFLF